MKITYINNGFEIFVNGLLSPNSKEAGVGVYCRHLCREAIGGDGLPKTLLDDLSADFPSGKLTAIIGPSGCGKSTLLKALCGIEKADSGDVYFGGYNYYRSMHAFTRLFAYLPQFDDLFEQLDVYDELSITGYLRTGKLGKDERNLAIFRYLEVFGLSGKEDDKISSLSGGEKKRVAIIAALLSKPSVLFLDEPTAPLDPGTTQDFICQLKKIATEEQTTIIFVTHDPDALESVDRIVLLERGGSPVFSGAQEKFFEKLRAHYGRNMANGSLIKELFHDFSTEKSLPAFDDKIIHLCSISTSATIANLDVTRRNFFGQFAALSKREFRKFSGGGSSSLLLVLLPVIIGLILGMVVDGDDLYHKYSYTKSMMFAVSAGAFFTGVFSSITTLSNKNRIITEQLHGLNTGSLIIASFFILSIVCVIQSILLFGTFSLAAGSLPDVQLYSAQYDILTTLILCSISAMSLGLLCGAIFKKPTYVAPVLVLLQLVFSGIIFDLGDEGLAVAISGIISCKWAMNAFGAICDLNSLPNTIPINGTESEVIPPYDSSFEFSTYTLFESWFFMIILAALFLCLALVFVWFRKEAIYNSNLAGFRIARQVKQLSTVILRFLVSNGWILLITVTAITVAASLILGINLLPNDGLSFVTEIPSYLSSVLPSVPNHLQTFFDRWLFA